MPNKTYSRPSSTVSTWVKSQARMPSAWAARNCRQLCPPRCGAGSTPGPAQDQPHGRGRQPMAEPGQLAVDSAVTPAGVVRGHPQHQLPDARPGQWPTAAARNGPAAADQIPMPAQHRIRGHEQPRPAAARNQHNATCTARSAQRGPGSGDLPAQHRQLVAQNEDLRLLRRAAAGQQAKPVHRRRQDQVQQS